MTTQTKADVTSQEPLIKVSNGKRRFFFIILYLLFMSDMAARQGITGVMPMIQADLHLNDSQVGLISSAVFFGMALFVLPISYLGEKHSTKKATTFSAVIWGIGSCLGGVATGLGTLIASRFAVGMGNSAYAALSNSMLTSMYPQNQWGKRIGLYNTAMVVGGALGYVIFANIANVSGWRMAFWSIGIISLILALFTFALPEPKQYIAVKGERKNDNKVNLHTALNEVIKNKALILCCLGAGIGVLVLQGVNAWISIFLVREMHMTVVDAAKLVGSTSILTALAYPFGGAILDKWYKKDKRARVFMPMVFFMIAAASFSFGFTRHIFWFILGGQILYTMAGTSIHTATQELVPIWFKSFSYGTYVVFIQFLGALGPLFAGIISDSMGLIPAMLSLQIGWFVAAGVLYLASRYYRQYHDLARALEADQKEN